MDIHICIYIYIHMCVYIYIMPGENPESVGLSEVALTLVNKSPFYAYIHIYMYVCIYICTYIRTHTSKIYNMYIYVYIQDGDSVGGVSGWCARAPGWRKTGFVRTTSQLLVSHSVAAACRFPLSLPFLCAVILWNSSFRGSGKCGHEFAPKSFRRSLVSPAEIVPWKLSVEKTHDLEKQNIHAGISRERPNPGDYLRFGPSSLESVRLPCSAYYSFQDIPFLHVWPEVRVE